MRSSHFLSEIGVYMLRNTQNKVIWMDGQLIPWEDAKVHCLTHTLHYGCGVFEGVRAYATPKGPAIFRLEEHTKRLLNSAHILRMKSPFTFEQICQAQKEVIHHNQFPSAYIRPLLYYGSESLGVHADSLSVHLMIAAWEWGAILGADSVKKGIKVCTSSLRRPHIDSALIKSKTAGHYVNSVLAIAEARDHGCDEALMLDHRGFVSEGSVENFFMVRDSIIYMPDNSTPLEGITRDSVCRIAQDLGYTVKERNMTRDEVYIADEAFFCGIAAEVVPIRELDSRQIGSGLPGPITTHLQTTFAQVVRGEKSEYSKWLTYIPA